MNCPLLYRFRVIDKLPEPPSADALKGTLVHAILEDLFGLDRLERTPDRAHDLLQPTWEQLKEKTFDIDIREFNQGVYILKVFNDKTSYTERLVKF